MTDLTPDPKPRTPATATGLRLWDGPDIDGTDFYLDIEQWQRDILAIEAEAQRSAPGERERAARFVATYWRDAYMASDLLRRTGGSHPLACVLTALNGETDPNELGIAEDRWPDFLAALAQPDAPEAGG